MQPTEDAGESGWREPAFGATHPRSAPTGAASRSHLQAVDRELAGVDPQALDWLYGDAEAKDIRDMETSNLVRILAIQAIRDWKFCPLAIKGPNNEPAGGLPTDTNIGAPVTSLACLRARLNEHFAI